ncbi:MAG: gamma-glutamyl-gamma-aminobutyrate hydrolase family protein [Candidatus Helarchaeota archaeon]|nr:gamma-glutamyl-gamma-aminobutyrate hydrolase family protein [Candidatus Helarchaeota archaeon]
MRPIIGITWYREGDPCKRGRLSQYREAIKQAQGEPKILRAKRACGDLGPPKRGKIDLHQYVLEIGEPEEDLKERLKAIDGLLLTGDGDIHPGWYREEKHSCTRASQRAKFDLKLALLALDQEIPILGICLGPQVINVACGGKLDQEIPSGHGKGNHYKVWHLTRIMPDSKLHRILQQDELWTNSFHRQAVSDSELGNGLRVCAQSDDDVIEAVESNSDRFILGVQWHPEKYVKFVRKGKLKSHLEILFEDASRKLFSYFVKEAVVDKK